MSKYVSQDEIEAYEVAKQQMVEDEEKRREAINEEKEMIIQDGNDRMYEAIEASEEGNRGSSNGCR